MNEKQLITYAENYLRKKKIAFVSPGKIGERDSSRLEIIFLVPEALNPKAVVDPPDVRLWIDIKSRKIDIIEQM